jgi:hypothetical protein
VSWPSVWQIDFALSLSRSTGDAEEREILDDVLEEILLDKSGNGEAAWICHSPSTWFCAFSGVDVWLAWRVSNK